MKGILIEFLKNACFMLERIVYFDKNLIKKKRDNVSSTYFLSIYSIVSYFIWRVSMDKSAGAQRIVNETKKMVIIAARSFDLILSLSCSSVLWMYGAAIDEAWIGAKAREHRGGNTRRSYQRVASDASEWRLNGLQSDGKLHSVHWGRRGM